MFQSSGHAAACADPHHIPAALVPAVPAQDDKIRAASANMSEAPTSHADTQQEEAVPLGLEEAAAGDGSPDRKETRGMIAAKKRSLSELQGQAVDSPLKQSDIAPEQKVKQSGAQQYQPDSDDSHDSDCTESSKEEHDEPAAEATVRKRSKKSSSETNTILKRAEEQRCMALVHEQFLELSGREADWTGWKCEARLRTHGTKAGRYDSHYTSPDGKRFRSRPEVFRRVLPERAQSKKKKTYKTGPSPSKAPLSPGDASPARRKSQVKVPKAKREPVAQVKEPKAKLEPNAKRDPQTRREPMEPKEDTNLPSQQQQQPAPEAYIDAPTQLHKMKVTKDRKETKAAAPQPTKAVGPKPPRKAALRVKALPPGGAKRPPKPSREKPSPAEHQLATYLATKSNQSAIAQIEAELVKRGRANNAERKRVGPALPRWQQAKNAKEEVASHQQLRFPLKVGHDVVIHRLGTPVATPGFHTSTCMYPTETLVSWRDVKRTCTIFFCITSYSAPVATPTAAAAGCASTSAAAAVETYEVPLFTITAVCGNVNPPQTGTVSEALRSFGSEAVEVSRSFQSPEEACTKLFALHELAEALYAPNGPCDAQSAAVIEAADAAVAAQAAGESMEGMTEFYLLLLRGDEKLLRTLQQLPMVPMRCPCLLFGLSEIPVMMLLEGHEAVEHCLHYKYAQDRGGWSAESEAMHLQLRLCMRNALQRIDRQNKRQKALLLKAAAAGVTKTKTGQHKAGETKRGKGGVGGAKGGNEGGSNKAGVDPKQTKQSNTHPTEACQEPFTDATAQTHEKISKENVLEPQVIAPSIGNQTEAGFSGEGAHAVAGEASVPACKVVQTV